MVCYTGSTGKYWKTATIGDFVCMFRRKIDQRLQDWKNTGTEKVLVVEGIRRVGKSTSVEAFTRDNYKNIAWLDFRRKREYFDLVAPFVDLEITNYMIAKVTGTDLQSDETVIVFDQPDLITGVDMEKILQEYQQDGRYTVIVITGENAIADEKIPKIRMSAMDFEEFLWAKGEPESIMDYLRENFRLRKPVPELLHRDLMQQLREYVIVGGFPEAVFQFCQSKHFDQVLGIQNRIREQLVEELMIRRSGQHKYRTHVANIVQVLDAVPVNLAKENKKFLLKNVEQQGNNRSLEKFIREIEDSGYLYRCKNLKEPFPTAQSISENVYEAYLPDIGWYAGNMPAYVREGLIHGDPHLPDYGIRHSLFADFLIKAGKEMYYYRRRTGLAADFVLPGKDGSEIIELRKGSKRAVSTILNDHAESVREAVLVGDWNLSEKDRRLFLPWYMGPVYIESNQAAG